MDKRIKEQRQECANRLREIRLTMDMSQENFADILGISLSAYKKIESGCNGISVSVLRKLREKFSISSDYLLFGSYEEYNNVMDVIQNCKEADKMRILLELTQYFVEIKN